MLTEGQTIFRAQHSLKSSDEVEWEKLTETQACAALLTHDRLLTRYSQPTARHVVRAVENSGQSLSPLQAFCLRRSVRCCSQTRAGVTSRASREYEPTRASAAVAEGCAIHCVRCIKPLWQSTRAAVGVPPIHPSVPQRTSAS